MGDKNDMQDLQPEEKAALAKLERKQDPPRTVEEATVSLLQSRGLLNKRRFQNMFSFPQLTVSFAAAFVVFAIGFGVGRWQAESPVAQGGPQFALLIHADDVPADDPLQQTREYGRWMHKILESGRFATGEKLQETGRVVRAKEGRVEIQDVSAGPEFGRVSGFFLIEAESYEDAVEVASTCPHLEYQGTIEVRALDLVRN